MQRHMNGAGRASLLRRIQAASKNDMELDHALKAYGAGPGRLRCCSAKHIMIAVVCGSALASLSASPATFKHNTGPVLMPRLAW